MSWLLGLSWQFLEVYPVQILWLPAGDHSHSAEHSPPALGSGSAPLVDPVSVNSHTALKVFLFLLPLFMLKTITVCYSVFGNVTNCLCKGNIFLASNVKYLFISYTVQW